MDKLDIFQCTKLLQQCVDKGILSTDPSDKNRILVYRGAGVQSTEGWYSEKLSCVAQTLANEQAGQQMLVEALRKKGVTFSCEPLPKSSFVFI